MVDSKFKLFLTEEEEPKEKEIILPFKSKSPVMIKAFCGETAKFIDTVDESKLVFFQNVANGIFNFNFEKFGAPVQTYIAKKKDHIQGSGAKVLKPVIKTILQKISADKLSNQGIFVSLRDEIQKSLLSFNALKKDAKTFLVNVSKNLRDPKNYKDENEVVAEELARKNDEKLITVYLGTNRNAADLFETHGFNNPSVATKITKYGMENLFFCKNVEDAQRYADKFEDGVVLEMRHDFGDVTWIKDQFKLDNTILKEDITINEVKTSEVFYIVDKHGSKVSGPYSEEIKAHDKLELLIKQAKKDKTDEEVENLKVQSFKESLNEGMETVYHGCSKKACSVLMDKGFEKGCYFTTNVEKAKRYARKDGTIFTIKYNFKEDKKVSSPTIKDEFRYEDTIPPTAITGQKEVE